MNNVEYIRDSFSDYLENKEAVSSSEIKNFLVSPRYYYWKKFEEVKPEEEPRHFFLGTCLHELILEPEEWQEHYCISRKFDLRTTRGKEALAEFEEKNKGKKILFVEEAEALNKMATNALNNKTFVELIKESWRELSIYATDEETGLRIKIRPDVFCKNKSTIVDLKSCQSASLKEFRWDVLKFGYNVSAALYMDVSKKEHYLFAATEKNEPYQFSLYELSEELIEKGRQAYRMALTLLKFCQENSCWPQYGEFETLKELYNNGEALERFLLLKEKENFINVIY